MTSPWANFIISSLIWGSTWIAITYQLGPVHGSWSVAYRFLIAGLLMYAFALWSRAPMRYGLKHHLYFAALGVFQFGVNFHLIYYVEHYIPSGLVAVAFATMVFFNAGLAWAVLGQRAGAAVIAGGALGVTGVLLIFWPEIGAIHWSDKAVYALVLTLVASLSASFGNLLPATRLGKSVPIVASNSWGMIYSGLGSAILASVIAGPPEWDARGSYAASLLFLAVAGSIVTFSCYMALIRSWGVQRAAYVSVMTPMVALVWSTALEGYTWTLLSGLGAALALGGTVIAIRGRR